MLHVTREGVNWGQEWGVGPLKNIAPGQIKTWHRFGPLVMACTVGEGSTPSRWQEQVQARRQILLGAHPCQALCHCLLYSSAEDGGQARIQAEGKGH